MKKASPEVAAALERRRRSRVIAVLLVVAVAALIALVPTVLSWGEKQRAQASAEQTVDNILAGEATPLPPGSIAASLIAQPSWAKPVGNSVLGADDGNAVVGFSASGTVEDIARRYRDAMVGIGWQVDVVDDQMQSIRFIRSDGKPYRADITLTEAYPGIITIVVQTWSQ